MLCVLSLQKGLFGGGSYLLSLCNMCPGNLRLCVHVSSLERSLEKDEILADVASRLWFTYRKNFPAIGEYCLLQRGMKCM